MNRLSRVTKRAAVLLSAAALVTATACSSGSSDPDQAQGENLDGRGAITFAMGNNDIDKIRPIVDAWNEANPDEQVSIHELAADADDQRESLVQSLQAGNSDYDVMALDVIWTGEFAANGWLQPLDGEMAIDTEGLLPATVASATYRDVLYAAPQNTNAQLLYYRTDLAPGGNAPANWAALVRSCEEIEAGGVDCLITQLKQYEGLTVNATQFIDSWGGSILTADSSAANLETDEARQGLQALVTAYQDGVIPEQATGFAEQETANAFIAGEAAYAYNWPYMIDVAETGEGSEVQGRFEVAPILGPTGPGASVLGGYNNGINVFSEHKQTARDFVAFVQSPENQRSLAEQSFPPVLASIYDDAALIEEFPYLPVLKTALENAVPRPVSPHYTAISKAIQDNVYAALNNSKSVDQAITDMQAAINNAIE